jgi:hypothetical protein
MSIFGIPVLIGFQELRPNLDLCRELGLDFVELNMNLPYSFPENISSHEVRAAVKEGMRFSMHLHDELDLGSLQPSVRLGHLQRCEEALRWGSRHGVFLINLHLNPGVYFTLPDRKVWVYERYLDEYVESLSSSFERYRPWPNSLGIRIGVENTGLSPIPSCAGGRIHLDFPSTGYAGTSPCWTFRPLGGGLHASQLDRHGTCTSMIGCNSDHQIPYTGLLDCDRYPDLAEEKGMSVLVEVKTEGSVRSAIGVMRDRGHIPASRSFQ